MRWRRWRGRFLERRWKGWWSRAAVVQMPLWLLVMLVVVKALVARGQRQAPLGAGLLFFSLAHVQLAL